MRTTALTTAALLGLALLGPVPVAHAAGETCRGEAATIVGTPGNPALLGSDGVIGTEGRDVVVTNGEFKVSTLGGDDLICVTSGGSSVRRVLIDSGAGDDVVDGTTAPDWIVQAELGEGADQFAGGDAGSSVRGAYDRATPADTERDVIVGGAGSDGVTSGVAGQPNPDVIALGAGNDSLFYGGVTASGGSIDGGTGVDELVPSTLSTPGEATLIDNAAGRMLIDQQVVATWTGMETFWTGSSAVFGGNSLVFVGTAADETVYAQVAGQVRATFGAGDDSFLADQAPRAGSVIDGGDGRDLLYVTSRAGLLDLDLRSGRMRASAGAPYKFSATDFEDASLFAQRVVIGGTDSRNELSFSACDANVSGRGGADTIARYYDSLYESVFCPRYPKARLNGGSGRDDITGTIGKDVLLGGSGPDELRGENGTDVLRGGGGSDRLYGGQSRDHADGGSGRKDLCRAERKQRCER